MDRQHETYFTLHIYISDIAVYTINEIYTLYVIFSVFLAWKYHSYHVSYLLVPVQFPVCVSTEKIEMMGFIFILSSYQLFFILSFILANIDKYVEGLSLYIIIGDYDLSSDDQTMLFWNACMFILIMLTLLCI